MMRIDYDIVQGDSLFIDIQPVDDADQPFDLTGFLAEVAVEYVNAAGAVVQWTASSPASVTLGPDGIISTVVPPAATAAIPADRRVTWQMRLTDLAANKQTIAEGMIRVRNSSLF